MAQVCLYIAPIADVVAGRSERKPLVGGVAVANVSDMGVVECDDRCVRDLAAVVFEVDWRRFDLQRVYQCVHTQRVADQAGGVK